ncbi:MAG: ABC transporter ATP-binding protein [Planctomycetota bacterium]|nr:ABC transporter ATP-binding protein [Planctomycetota bacterium]
MSDDIRDNLHVLEPQPDSSILMPVIETRQLGKQYGPRVGIERVDLSVAEGEIFGFLGPNGAGKSTTIRLLLGFLKPTQGDALVFGHDSWKQSHILKREVGYLPGDVRLYPWLTVRRALSFVGAARGADLMDAGLALAERLSLEPDLIARKMSRGMRQKLAIIMVLAHAPRLIILDEPTSGLDPLVQLSLAQELRDRADKGSTVFFSSHTLNEVEQLCDRVAIVREGRIVADETLDDMRKKARRKVTIRFTDGEAVRGLDPPEFLTLIKREGDRWHAELDGEAGRLMQWLAGQSIRDLTIGPPDLETLFHAHYRTSEGTL